MMILSGIVTIYAYGGGGKDRRIGRDLSGRSQNRFVSVGAGQSRPRSQQASAPRHRALGGEIGNPGSGSLQELSCLRTFEFC
jgi:hypothetical protein